MTRRVPAWPFFWLTGLLLLATLGTWRWYVNNPPSKPAQYGAVSGVLYSLSGGAPGDKGLVFYLRESRIRFCVPADGYDQSFDAEAFSANVRPGARLTIEAPQSELQRPSEPLLNPNPTVFVAGLRDSRHVYSTIAGRVRWERDNRALGLDFAYVLGALTLASLLASLYFLTHEVREKVLPSAKEWTPQYKLQIGLIQLFASSVTLLGFWLARHFFFPKLPFGAGGYVFLIFFSGIYRCICGWRELRRQGNIESAPQ